MEELKPCPFCGGEAVLLENIDEYYQIGCKNESCYAFCDPSNPIVYINESMAITAWNTRKDNNGNTKS